MEQLRMRAREGLMAAPRVGMSVGGLLLGVRQDSRILLLDSIELPCSHSTGPSFTLTTAEKQESRDLVAEANTLSAASKVGVIGWYCSKTRGDAILGASDLDLFAELLPGAGQLAVVLRPDIFESMRAAFFYRDRRGEVVKAFECEVEEWRPAPDPRTELDDKTAEQPVDAVPPGPEKEHPAVQPVVAADLAPEAPKAVEKRMSAAQHAEAAEPVKSRPASTTLEDIIGLSASEGPAKPAGSTVRRPVIFDAPPPPVRRFHISKRLLTAIGVAAVLVLGLVCYLTRDAWLPRPPLSLTFSELDGSLLIHWDPQAVRGIDHASMYVNDGGQPTPEVIPLDRLQLNVGLLSYMPKSKRVTAKLAAGRTSAINSWFAPENPKSQMPAADTTTPASSSDSAPPLPSVLSSGTAAAGMPPGAGKR